MRLRALVIRGLVILIALTAVPGQAQAATLAVTKTDDTNDGVCDADCSLREAIFAANALAGADIITVPAGTYALSIAGPEEDNTATGDLDITDDLTINGAGAADTIIDGGELDRLFHILSGTVSISGVTVQNGAVIAFNRNGGGIENFGTLTLTDSAVSGNSAGSIGGGIHNSNLGSAELISSTLNDNTAASGGGIGNNGTLIVNNSFVRGNTGGFGGGILNRQNAKLTITASTISKNNATISDGGGIWNGGEMSIVESTIDDNHSSLNGGGIANSNNGTQVISNTTVSGNSSRFGGGIAHHALGTTTIRYSTITENRGTSAGGGIAKSLGTLAVNSVIIANDLGGNCAGNPLTSLGHNLSSDDTCNLTEPTDLPNTEPLLGTLQNNGGMTETHALLPGSPAIDAGDDIAAPPTDQRGVIRPQGAVSDIGAFELEAAPFSCSNVSEIPTLECEALVVLFNTTDGPNWKDNTGWLETDTPCSWYGVACDAGHVTQLKLPDNQLSGSITPELGNLFSLTDLHLFKNDLTGSIPLELGNLSSLTNLFLYINDLTGGIPPELGNLSSVTGLFLHENQLSGGIPQELGNLSSLETLHLGSNQLSGSIPPQLGNLSNLKQLYLSGNLLDGSIPAELENLSSLEGLYLHNNQLSGEIPEELGSLSSLDTLHVGTNQLGGSLPQSLTNLSLVKFWFHDNALCEPPNAEFQAWLAGISDLRSTGIVCITTLCTLKLGLGYADGALTMDFELATLEPATWDLWLVIPGTGIFPLWSLPLPVVDSPVFPSLSFSFPSIGTIGFLTSLSTPEGIACSDWETVDTGAPSSAVPSRGEIRELFRGVNKVLSNEQ